MSLPFRPQPQIRSDFDLPLGLRSDGNVTCKLFMMCYAIIKPAPDPASEIANGDHSARQATNFAEHVVSKP